MKGSRCHSKPEIGLRARCVTRGSADVSCPGGSLQTRLVGRWHVRAMKLCLTGMDVECGSCQPSLCSPVFGIKCHRRKEPRELEIHHFQEGLLTALRAEGSAVEGERVCSGPHHAHASAGVPFRESPTHVPRPGREIISASPVQ